MTNEHEFKRTDYGTIEFGTKFNSKKWSEVPDWWLEYVASDECMTADIHKSIARQELKQRKILDRQLESPELKTYHCKRCNLYWLWSEVVKLKDKDGKIINLSCKLCEGIINETN